MTRRMTVMTPDLNSVLAALAHVTEKDADRIFTPLLFILTGVLVAAIILTILFEGKKKGKDGRNDDKYRK